MRARHGENYKDVQILLWPPPSDAVTGPTRVLGGHAGLPLGAHDQGQVVAGAGAGAGAGAEHMHTVLRPRTTHTSPTTGGPTPTASEHCYARLSSLATWHRSGHTTYLRRPCSSNTSTIRASASDLRLGLAADSSRMCCTNLGRL